MASSGKKGKKSKGKTLALNDFLQDTSTGTPTLPVKKYTNWSDEVEDAFETGYESRPKTTPVILPTAPRAARGPDISDDKIPTHPPYIAYISNLPYDVDEDDIADFFRNMDISSMRLPRDDRGGEGGKLKGFGYVEFENRNSLIEAISIIDTNLKGRRIKIDVATSSDGDRRRGGRMDMGRDRPERPEVTSSDWRSGPRSEPPPDSRPSGSGFRDRDGFSENRSSGGTWRDSSDRPNLREYDRDRGFSRDSERSFGRDRDTDRDRGYKDNERGFSRDSDRNRYPDRERDRDRDGDRRGGSGFGPRRYGGDRENFDKDNEIRRRDEEKEQPRSRPKLKLAPRTKPLEDPAPVPAPPAEVTEEKESTTATSAVPAASIFGAAKPVDTAARERQIEERLAKEKESRPAPRENSRNRDNKSGDEEEKAPKKEAWTRKRNDDNENSHRNSPDQRPNSRGPPARRNDERKPGPPGNREKVQNKREEKPVKREERNTRDYYEREMPKLKEPEPPNFAASNIFATLEPDDCLDD